MEHTMNTTMNTTRSALWRIALAGLGLFLIHFLIAGITRMVLKFEGGLLLFSLLSTNMLLVLGLCRLLKIRTIQQGGLAGVFWLGTYAIMDYLVVIQILLEGNIVGFYTGGILTGYAIILLLPVIVGATYQYILSK